MKRLTLVQMNDLHGYMEEHAEWYWSASGFEYRKAGGLGRIKAYVDGLRARGEHVLFCDNGDTLHGTFPLVDSEGKIILPMLNTMGLAAMTAHWEFAYGPAKLIENAKQLRHPLLALNVYWKATGERVFPASTVVEIDGVRVGILGIACNIVDKTMPASYSEGIRFTDGMDELPLLIEEMRRKERPDVVVLLSHLGFPQDCELLARIPGIDVCFSSHTHNRLYEPVLIGDTIVVQSGCHGSFLSRLEVSIESQTVRLQSHELVSIDESLASDAEMDAMVARSMAPYRERLNEVVGSTGTSLNRATMLESTADNFLLQSLASATEARLAFSNGWRYGAPIPRGQVTRNDLYNLVPMNPEITRVELKGAELVQMIEENLERTYSRDAMAQMGGYTKRCLGMRAYFKVENPKGHRVQDLFVGQERVVKTAIYSAAFITAQGVPERLGSNREQSGIHAVEAMEQQLKKRVPSDLLGTFSLV